MAFMVRNCHLVRNPLTESLTSDDETWVTSSEKRLQQLVKERDLLDAESDHLEDDDDGTWVTCLESRLEQLRREREQLNRKDGSSESVVSEKDQQLLGQTLCKNDRPIAGLICNLCFVTTSDNSLMEQHLMEQSHLSKVEKETSMLMARSEFKEISFCNETVNEMEKVADHGKLNNCSGEKINDEIGVSVIEMTKERDNLKGVEVEVNHNSKDNQIDNQNMEDCENDPPHEAIKTPNETNHEIHKIIDEDKNSQEEEIPNRLHVSKIPFRFRDTDLKIMFEDFGTVLDAEVIFNERGSKGFGFVTLDNAENVIKAQRALDGAELEGRVIEVNYATKRTLQMKHQNAMKQHFMMTQNMQPTEDVDCNHNLINYNHNPRNWSEGLTKISNVLDEEKESIHEDECEVHELQIVKLRKLAKALKMKTLVGEENMDEIVNKVADDEIYQRFHDLQIRYCEIMDERDLLENTVKRSKEIVKEMQETLIDKETKAKNEKSNLNTSLKVSYKGNTEKPKENNSVETNKRLVEEFHRLNLASAKKDKTILELKEDLAEAREKIQDLKRDYQAMSYNQNSNVNYHNQNRFFGGYSQNYFSNHNAANQFGSVPGYFNHNSNAGNHVQDIIKHRQGYFNHNNNASNHVQYMINHHQSYINHNRNTGTYFSYNGYNVDGYQSYMYQSRNIGYQTIHQHRNRGYQTFW